MPFSRRSLSYSRYCITCYFYLLILHTIFHVAHLNKGKCSGKYWICIGGEPYPQVKHYFHLREMSKKKIRSWTTWSWWLIYLLCFTLIELSRKRNIWSCFSHVHSTRKCLLYVKFKHMHEILSHFNNKVSSSFWITVDFTRNYFIHKKLQSSVLIPSLISNKPDRDISFFFRPSFRH